MRQVVSSDVLVIMKNVKCEICGSSKYTNLYRKKSYIETKYGNINLVKCSECGLIYINPQLSEDELADYYDVDYYGINNKRFSGIIERLIRLKRNIRAEVISRFTEKGKILDIGCGRGLFLDEMRGRGWDTYGTEISETAAKYAREVLGPNISIGELDQHRFPDSHFNAVSIYNVLEHVSHPADIMLEIRRILKPGGILVVALPNIDSWQAKIFRMRWFHLDLPRHNFHFSPETLAKLLPPEHWDTVRTKRLSLEFGPFGWIQSALNVIFGNENMLYEILKEKTSGRLRIYARNRFKFFRWTIISLNLVMAALLAVPSVLFSLVSSMTRHNEIMEIYYRKK